MAEEINKVTVNAFERHAQTALVLLLVALLLWVGNTTQSTAVTVAEMRVELSFLKATMDKPHRHQALDELSQSIQECRNRLSKLENEHN